MLNGPHYDDKHAADSLKPPAVLLCCSGYFYLHRPNLPLKLLVDNLLCPANDETSVARELYNKPTEPFLITASFPAATSLRIVIVFPARLVNTGGRCRTGRLRPLRRP